MKEILQFAFAGGIAQLIDGMLGMAFGVISSSLLVLLGAAPVAASMATHFAKFGTTAASGIAHWRLGNVDKVIALRLGMSGSIGAIVGAIFLVNAAMDGAKSGMAGLLLVLGLILIIRFGFNVNIIPVVSQNVHSKMLIPLGLVGGFVDATGGGGWGPVTTPTLLTLTKTEPRMVIGTVNAAEFIVATAASISFITTSSIQGFEWQPVIGLIIGGLIAAPYAARITSKFPHQPLGVLVGGLVVLANFNTLAGLYGFSSQVKYSVLLLVLVIVVFLANRLNKRNKK
jgi:uncharacterized membrane protein YfcA